MFGREVVIHMPIPVQCSCGKLCRAKDEAAGKRVRCPKCGNILQVPSASDQAEAVALELLLAAPSASAPLSIESEPVAPTPPPIVRAVQESPRRPKTWGEAATAKPEKPKRGPRVVFEEGWFGSINSGVIGGVLMIAIAGIWFGLGLMAGRIFIYPPILGVIGFISILKGMGGGGD
jgi:hypothetical protein